LSDILNAALRLLSYRPRSESELRKRLSKTFAIHLVDDAIDQLKSQGLIDDVAFATFWSRNRQKYRPKGAATVRWELLNMGVSGETIQSTLEDFDEGSAARLAVIRVAERLVTQGQKVFERKVGGHLRRRGFASATVRGTVEQLWRELSDPSDSNISTQHYD